MIRAASSRACARDRVAPEAIRPVGRVGTSVVRRKVQIEAGDAGEGKVDRNCPLETRMRRPDINCPVATGSPLMSTVIWTPCNTDWVIEGINQYPGLLRS